MKNQPLARLGVRAARALGLAIAAGAFAVGPARADFPTGKPAPAFTLRRLAGPQLSLSALRGHVVLLDFWGYVCPPCRVEAPHLQALHKKYYGQGLRLLGIAEMNPTPSEARAFQKEFGLTYPLLLDPGEKVGARYRLEGHPTAILLDRQGVVRFVHTGFLEGDETLLDEAVRAVLAGKEPPKEAPL